MRAFVRNEKTQKTVYGATLTARRKTASFIRAFIGLFLLGIFLMAAAGAQAAPTRLVQLSQVNFGALLLRSNEPGKYIEAPLIAADIDITVTGVIARARITQRFKNPSEGWVEGKYVFPLPDNAAVDTLKMIIGTRFIEGRIKERKEAKEIYEKAKKEGKKAALVEQERPNMFTNSVANIGPGETIVVQLEYQHETRLDNGFYSLRAPLVVAPRYLPKPNVHMVSHQPGQTTITVTDPVPDADRITPPVRDPSTGIRNPVTISIRLDPGFEIDKIESPHHKIAVKRLEGHALIGLEDGEVWADRDFELRWNAKAGEAPQASIFTEVMNGETYILAMINPPELVSNAQTKPREVIFVIDNSGSMSGESMRQAKDGLIYALDRLKPKDSFNVIRFDDTMDILFPKTVRANDGNKALAQGFVRALEANGGTEMLPALKAALIDATPEDETRLRQVIFLTDGAIGNESQLFAQIQKGLGRSRIFTVGIGSAPNSFFMTRAATYGRGAFTHIGQTSEVTARMQVLANKLEHPAMTGLKAEFPGSADPESWPNPLPDLYLGEPIVLTAKLPQNSGEVKLGGNYNDKPWSMNISLADAREGSGIAKLWARRKIMALEGMRFQFQDWKVHDKMVLDVALGYGLVSRTTSLVAVDVTPSRPEGAELVSAEVPLNLPNGWNFKKVFGMQHAPMMRDASAKPNVQLASLLKVSKTKAAQVKKPGLALPAGATMAERKIMTGILALILALSLGMLMVFWRHLNGAYNPGRHA